MISQEEMEALRRGPDPSQPVKSKTSNILDDDDDENVNSNSNSRSQDDKGRINVNANYFEQSI